jgi:hypothetical protein
MKIQILRVCVLLVSISAASVLVWNATRNKEPKETRKDDVVSPSSMQSSSKSMIFDHIRIEDFSPITVEGGKVIFSSKEGFEMSEEEMRAWKLATEAELKPHLMSSSKSGPAMTLDEFFKFMEARQKATSKDDTESQEPLMHSSKSFSGPVFEPKELKKIIEGEKQEPNDLQELPPQEE